MNRKFLILTILIFLLLPAAYAHVADYSHTEILNVTLLAAFLGGILMLLSPCTFSVLPAYFAYTFQQKRRLLLATSIFVLGFAFMFSLFGFTASFIGYYLNLYKSEMTFYLGFLLILFGFLLLIGKGFPSFRINKRFDNTPIGAFLFGIIYSFGYAGCAGPILAGILLIAATLPSFNASLLMFAYALGFGIPLIAASYFFDRFKIFDIKIFYKPIFNFRNKIITTVPNLISAILFFLIGYVYIKYRSIYPFSFGFPTLQSISYSLQENLLQLSIPAPNLLFVLVVILLLFAIIKLSKINKISKKELKKR